MGRGIKNHFQTSEHFFDRGTSTITVTILNFIRDGEVHGWKLLCTQKTNINVHSAVIFPFLLFLLACLLLTEKKNRYYKKAHTLALSLFPWLKNHSFSTSLICTFFLEKSFTHFLNKYFETAVGLYGILLNLIEKLKMLFELKNLRFQ